MPKALSPVQFPTLTAFTTAMNRAGQRLDGPAALAVWQSSVRSDHGMNRREGRMHSHPRGQLMCIEDGLAQVRSAKGSWLLPPMRAVWIPPGESHEISAFAVTRSWNLFLLPAAARALPSNPCVIAVSNLMHELVQRVTLWDDCDRLLPSQRRILWVLLDEIQRAPHDLLHLPLPTDRRLARIASAVVQNPEDTRTRKEWAAWAGMSDRTLSRQFQAQVHMSFARWKQQALLIHAVERLLKGDSVASVSDALGYAAPSAFISMFRKALGETPARYVANSSGSRF